MSKELKVLHIIDSLGLGGAQTVVKGIFEYQQENKDIFLFALRKRKILTEVNHKNVTVFNSEKKYSLKPLFELRDLIRRENIDVLHCHLFRSNVFGLLLKIINPKIKLIIHEHGGIVEDGIFYKVSIFIIQFFSYKIISVSNFIKSRLISTALLNPKKIYVLHNFVDINKYKKIFFDKKKYFKDLGIGYEESLKVIGFAGRLTERKGWKVFVQTAINIHNKYPSRFLFIIAGAGKDEPLLSLFIKENNASSFIHAVGFQKDMISFYSALDIATIPSLWEGMPMAQLEIMSIGTPLISSNGGGLTELAKDNESCLYFEVGNSDSFAKAIVYLSNSSPLQEKLTLNSKCVASQNTLEQFLVKLNCLYK